MPAGVDSRLTAEGACGRVVHACSCPEHPTGCPGGLVWAGAGCSVLGSTGPVCGVPSECFQKGGRPRSLE